MLTIMVAHGLQKEYKLYGDFFGKLNKEEQEEYENLVKELYKLDNDNSHVQWSFLKQYFGIISKTCDNVLSCPDDEFSKSDKRIQKKIKSHI